MLTALLVFIVDAAALVTLQEVATSLRVPRAHFAAAWFVLICAVIIGNCSATRATADDRPTLDARGPHH